MTIRSVAKSVLALLLVAVSSYVLEVRLHRNGIPSRDLILLSSFLVGLVAGALVYFLSVRERQRRAYVDCRLRVIAEMNHHVRNALQVITFYSRKGEKQEVGVVEAVERIQWALREVLPQLPESPAETNTETSAIPESYPRMMELKRPELVAVVVSRNSRNGRDEQI